MDKQKRGSFSNIDIKKVVPPKAKKKLSFEQPKLMVSVGPHVRSKDSIAKIMWTVFVALLPACVWSVYYFGYLAAVNILTAILACMITEVVMKLLRGTPIQVWDGSAAVTGILIAFNLPYKAPIFVAIVASVVAIAVVKEFFGGLGNNFINPALAGRAFVMFASIGTMSDKMNYLVINKAKIATSVDAIASATPMAALAYFNKGTYTGDQLPNLFDLFLGRCGGSLGETSALFLLIGFLVLLYKGYVQWRISLFYILTVFSFTFLYALFGGIKLIDPSFTNIQNSFVYSLYHILGGGLMLGALFMATDMVTSPVTRLGSIIFGIGCGLITIFIRIFGQYPEGVMFSILLMNLATPLIDKAIKPRIYGTKRG